MNDVLWLKFVIGLILTTPAGAWRDLAIKKYERLTCDVADIPGRLIAQIDAKSFTDAAELDATHRQELVRALVGWDRPI